MLPERTIDPLFVADGFRVFEMDESPEPGGGLKVIEHEVISEDPETRVSDPLIVALAAVVLIIVGENATAVIFSVGVAADATGAPT